jgi:hypothetical protein
MRLDGKSALATGAGGGSIVNISSTAGIRPRHGRTELFKGQPNSPEMRRRFLSTLPLGRLA